MASELEKAVKTLKEEIVKSKKEIKSAIEASEVKLLLKIEELNHRVNDLEIENNNLTNKIETLEIISKKNNIIIFGLDKPDLSPTLICEKLKGLLKIDVKLSDLNNVYPLKTTGRKSLKVEFISYSKKLEVFKNCKNLKGTGIGISNDLTYKQRQENKILRSFLNRARQNNPEDRTFIKGNKLYINNKAYTVEELEENVKSHSGERKINSAPSTPQKFNLSESENQTDEHFSKEVQREVFRQDSVEGLPSTPSEHNPKKTSKAAISTQPKDRLKTLRSGSTSTSRR